jgi:hypothetical protein
MFNLFKSKKKSTKVPEMLCDQSLLRGSVYRLTSEQIHDLRSKVANIRGRINLLEMELNYVTKILRRSGVDI